MVAAERMGRRARLMELDPRYVDVVMQRWEEATSGAAVEAQSLRPFGAVVSGR